MKSKAIQYGLLAGIIGVIVSLITTLLFEDKIVQGKFGIHSIFPLFTWIFLIYCMYAAPAFIKKASAGFIPFVKALKESYIVALVNGVIVSAFMFVSNMFLFPEVIRKTKEYSLTKMEDQMGNASEAQLEQAAKFAEIIIDWSPLIPIVSAIFSGIIVALIIAAILQKTKPEYIPEAN